MKKGVRSSSLASTVFSRIKKAGARIKGAASTHTGSSSVKSGLFGSLWGSESLKVGRQSIKSGHTGLGGENEVVHDAIAAFHGGGDAGPDSITAVVHVSDGSNTQHRRSSLDEHSEGGRVRRRSSVDGGRYSSTGSGHDRHVSSAGHNAGERRRSVDRHTTAADRRRTGEGVRFAEQPHKGPVGEEVCQPEVLVTGWDTGIRQRRHLIGLQHQYGVPPGSAGSSRRTSSDSRRVSSDSRRASAEGSEGDPHDDATGLQAMGSLQPTGSLQRRQFLTMRRTSSSNNSTASTSSSMKFRIDTAAAFAAAAAANALQPVHAFPEFLDTSSDEDSRERRSSKRAGARAGQQEQPSGYADALAESLQAAGIQDRDSRSSKKRSKQSSSTSTAEEEAPFTWHEFLSTINAIDHPSKVREQQQAAAAGSFRASSTAAATLGPIAEGVESDSDSPAQVPRHRPASGYTAALGGEGAATISHGVAAAAAAIVAHVMSPRPPAGPKPATANRSRPQQQLVLDNIESELASLGLQPGNEESTTPFLLLKSNNSAGTAAAETDVGDSSRGASAGRLQQTWPGLEDESSPDPAVAAEAGSASLRPQSGSAFSSRPQGTPHFESEDSRDSPSQPTKPRRVTLFTESMRLRNQGPQAPNSPRHSYKPDRAPSHAGASNLRASAAVAMPEGDELVEDARGAVGSAAGGAEDGYARSPSTQFDAALLLDGAVASVEPSITAKAIKRRKAAAGVSVDLGFEERLMQYTDHFRHESIMLLCASVNH